MEEFVFVLQSGELKQFSTICFRRRISLGRFFVPSSFSPSLRMNHHPPPKVLLRSFSYKNSSILMVLVFFFRFSQLSTLLFSQRFSEAEVF